MTYSVSYRIVSYCIVFSSLQKDSWKQASSLQLPFSLEQPSWWQQSLEQRPSTKTICWPWFLQQTWYLARIPMNSCPHENMRWMQDLGQHQIRNHYSIGCLRVVAMMVQMRLQQKQRGKEIQASFYFRCIGNRGKIRIYDHKMGSSQISYATKIKVQYSCM